VSDNVQFEVSEGSGIVRLDRPRAINALSPQMLQEVDAQLRAWIDEDAIERVELRGEGERGFCSGADVRAIRELVSTQPEEAVAFFEHEYELDALIATYPKPVTALIHGISMGGGLGLALHAAEVVSAPDLVLAMPETTIGLFPDVGIDWQLSRAPGQTGAYLAMTGTSIDAGSALWAGMVDRVAGDLPEGPCQLETDAVWVDECFAGDDATAIVARLEEHSDGRARGAGALLRTKSPLSVCVALEAVRRAESMSDVGEVLAQDLVLAQNFVADSDFCEGVRAQLVDKDRNPVWSIARIEDVSRERVEQMFR